MKDFLVIQRATDGVHGTQFYVVRTTVPTVFVLLVCLTSLPTGFEATAIHTRPTTRSGSLLNSLGIWRDEEYLTLKEKRTVRHDKREIMPLCI